MTTTVDVRDLVVQRSRRNLVDGVTLHVEQASWLCVLGPNGAGKSTLLKAIAGAVPTTSGSITVDGISLAGASARQRASTIAYCPQEPVLPEYMTVEQYVMLSRTAALPWMSAPSDTAREVVSETLRRVDLHHLASRSLGTLSGGEHKRAAIAQTLAQGCRVMLLDEPASSLDIGHQQEVLEILHSLCDSGVTLITTSHDLTLAGQYADRLALLDRGRLVADGVPRQVLTPELIAEHYGAKVAVHETENGVEVTPVRNGR